MYNYPRTYLPQPGYAPQQMQPQMPMTAPQQPVMQQAQMQPQMTQGYICQPVTSREEALAVQAQYFSPGTLMPDLAHGKIYLKRFNADTGASDMYEFSLPEPPAAPAPQNTPDLTNVLDRLTALEQEVSTLRKGENK